MRFPHGLSWKTKSLRFDIRDDAFWTLKVADAPEDFFINGPFKQGERGRTIGCSLSARAMEVTEDMWLFWPYVAYRIIKRKGAVPTHALRYAHSFKGLVELNDLGILSEYSSGITVRKPRKETGRKRGSDTNEGDGSPRLFVPTGCLNRAVKAGLVSIAQARHISASRAHKAKTA